jgi:iron complex outermembrane recepter protein
MSKSFYVSLLASVSVGAMSASVAQAAPATASVTDAATAAAAGASAAAGGTVGEVIVTAQHRRELEQTVPIAVTAITGKMMKAEKIETGADLIREVPNATFTKTNFSGYDLTIRGIGTEAVSVTTDPGVSVDYNGTALIRNRLFEQEFFDIDQVEVLSGPQGTLYGRNATAGVVNIKSALPTDDYEGDLKAEVGNYDSKRLSGYVNLPLAGDKLELRIAGAWTDRNGYDFNSGTNSSIDGRDLYSTRTTLQFRPTSNFKADLIWEHFNEDDNRARSTKQLCTPDPGPSSIDGFALTPEESAAFSQGCKDAPLTSNAAFGTPNGFALPFVQAGLNVSQIGLSAGPTNPLATGVPLLNNVNPFGGVTQSSNLRDIDAPFNPQYRATTDLVELNADWDFAPHLTLTSQTAFETDSYFSSQSYDSFESVPGVFTNSNGLFSESGLGGPTADNITPGGVFTDPQLGSSSSIEGEDVSNAKSLQISQEFRVQSSFSGPFNFSAGTNYTYYQTEENYYVFFNLLTALAESNGTGNGVPGLEGCAKPSSTSPANPGGTCQVFIDTRPLASVVANSGDDAGHNYYLNQNPYWLNSGAIFGEFYYDITPTLKLTAGARLTVDDKSFQPVPTQLLLGAGDGGTVAGGFPAQASINQIWVAPTGRIALQWTPKLSFTDQTMIYASYNRGYKAGGANPPSPGVNSTPLGPGLPAFIVLQPFPPTFLPEYVNAFEVGAKNTLLHGALVLNGDLFFYNYQNYQVSQVENDTEVNQNFNANTWGAEFHSVWAATPRLRFDVNLGWEGSALDHGSYSIDVENRTNGRPGFTVVQPFPTNPDNCVIADSFALQLLKLTQSLGLSPTAFAEGLCSGSIDSGVVQALLGAPTAAEQPHGGQGFFDNVSGHSLPQQPAFTQSVGAQYTYPLSNAWSAILRGDWYNQTDSWARVYMDPIDKLPGWSNINLSLTVAEPSANLQFEVYVKNLLNATPLTGAYLNSDNTALTANVFTLDPRIIAFSVEKKF